MTSKTDQKSPSAGDHSLDRDDDDDDEENSFFKEKFSVLYRGGSPG
jgi:hypothetical protein